MLKLLKPAGQLGIVLPASPQPVPHPIPQQLGDEWYWLKSIDWWREWWERNPQLDTHNTALEKRQVEEDKGRYLGFLRMVAEKQP